MGFVGLALPCMAQDIRNKGVRGSGLLKLLFHGVSEGVENNAPVSDTASFP